MRREVKKHFSYEIAIRKFYPRFLWHICDKCGYEVKSEKMWEIMVQGDYRGTETYDLVKLCTKEFCTECFPETEDGRQSLKEHCAEMITWQDEHFKK